MKNRRAYRAQLAAKSDDVKGTDQKKQRPTAKRHSRKLRSSKRKTGRTKPRPMLQRILIGAGIAAAVIVIAIVITTWIGYRSMVDQIDIVPSAEDALPSEFDQPTESLVNPVPSEKKVTNILLLGVDAQTDSIEGRSDAMMILTVNEQQGRIKLTSLQRDMMVYLPGRPYPDKLNAAHVYGGPALSMRVINDTFRLDLKKYVVVNMAGLTQLIDVAGGVEIEISREEARYLNLVKESGLQLLDGRQAVSYARLRKLDDDYMRMQRQRIVLQALLDAFVKASLGEKKSMIDEGLSLIQTNLSVNEITKLGLKILPKMNTTIEQMQLPVEGTFNSGMYSEGGMTSWQIRADFNAMIPPLQEFIWGRTYEFDKVKDIAGAPNSSLPLAKATPTPRPTLSPTPDPTPDPTPTLEPTPEPTETTTAATTTSTAASTETTAATETTAIPETSEPTETSVPDESTTEAPDESEDDATTTTTTTPAAATTETAAANGSPDDDNANNDNHQAGDDAVDDVSSDDIAA